MCIRNFSPIMNLIKSCSWNLRNIWRFFWRVILTIFDDVDDGVNLHHYLNPFRAPPSTSHTRTTSMATSAHVWRINMLYKKILKCVVLRPIPIVRTSNLGPQNRHFAAPRSSALRVYMCVFVCVRSTFISFTAIVVSWWSDRERGRVRDTPSPLHTQKRNSVEHIKALGKALQCFSCFQIFVHSSSLFFFFVPFSKFRRIAVVEELCLISATHRIWSVKRTSSQGRVLRASLPKWPPTSCRRNRSGPTSARMIPILRFHLPIIS